MPHDLLICALSHYYYTSLYVYRVSCSFHSIIVMGSDMDLVADPYLFLFSLPCKILPYPRSTSGPLDTFRDEPLLLCCTPTSSYFSLPSI